MGRRSDHTRDELKELAVSESLKLIRVKGVGEFSARSVAEKMKYSVGTLYHVFGDLETFRYHIRSAILTLLYQKVEHGVARNKDKLKALVSAYIDFALEESNIWNFLFSQPIKQQDKMPEWYEQQIAQLFDLMVDQIALHTATREAAKKASRVLWPSIHGICELAILDKLVLINAGKPKTLAHHLVDTYLAGLNKS